MRYPDGHKETVRARIVDAATRALQLGGLDGVSIPALMKQAGLTHGGFYGHFKDRGALLAAAIARSAEGTARGVFGDATKNVDAMLSDYLSMGHVQHPELGCVLAALGTEGGRQPAAVRKAFAQTARGFLHLVQKKLHPSSGPNTLGADALALAAQMIGAVVLARLVQDEALAERILAAARSH
jgi:AcrR family transcriptional regulator